MLILLTILNSFDLGLQVADPLLGIGAFLGMASLLGGLFSNNQQQATNERNIAFQQQENALNRMFAREQMATQQQYNEINSAKAYQRQREFYDYMYGKNSLSAMVKQAEEAGVNPFALFDSQGFQGTSVPSVQQTSAATPVNALGVAPHAEMIPTSFDKSVGAFSSIASALASISQSGKNKAETNAINVKLQHEVSKLINESELLHDQDVKQQLQNANDAYFSFSERQKGMDLLDAKISDMAKSLLLKDEELTSAKFENSLIDIKRELKNIERDLSKKKYEELEFIVSKLEDSYRHTFALQEAQMRAADASANQSNATAQTLNEVRPFEVGKAAEAVINGQFDIVRNMVGSVEDAVKLVDFMVKSPDEREKLKNEVRKLKRDELQSWLNMYFDKVRLHKIGVNLGPFGHFGFEGQ